MEKLGLEKLGKIGPDKVENWKVRQKKIGKLENWKHGKLRHRKIIGKLEKWKS